MKIESYKLDYDFDLKNKNFKGEEKIFLFIDKRKKQISLDSVNLDIRDVKLNDKKIQWQVCQDKLIIKSSLVRGKNLIEINFAGNLRESLGGIYLSKYYDNQNDQRYLITTQFEPTEARRAFPCFDHPALKAKFDISLIIDRDLSAISNTLPLREEKLGFKKKVIFKTTPLMSTYLVYLGIAKWYFLQSRYRKTILRLAVTNKNNIKAGYFALENAKKFLNYLERYFDCPYPLEKLDLISVPDFAAGAMENWGAITFRENLLLAFDKITSLSNKERILEVLAHELAHMWFGNLVTMEWWDDLWLNESFATYLAYKVVDHFYPQWRLKERYVLDEVISALNADGLHSSHSIKVKVSKPEESLEIFDEISYEKGGSVLRMIEEYIGEENFRNGLRNYIKKFSYQNANHEDFLMAFNEIVKEKVSKIIEGFIHQVNFPLIRIRQKDKYYLLSQEKFTFLPNKSNDWWQIPTKILVGDKEKKIILKKKREKLKKLIALNRNFSSFCLVDYDQRILYEILEKNKNLNDLDLIFLLRSYDFLIKKGEKNIFDFLNFLEKFFINVESKIVLSEIISILNFYYLFLGVKNIRDHLEKFSLKIISLLDKEPSKNELPFISSLRSRALISLGLVENKEILIFSQKKTKGSLANLNPEIKQAVLNNNVLSNDNFFDYLWRYYLGTKIIEEQNKCLTALGQTRNTEKAKSLMDLTLTDKIRFNQIIFVFASLASNRFLANTIFNWLDNNWLELEKRGGGAGESDLLLIKVLKLVMPFVGSFISWQQLVRFLNRKEIKKFSKTRKIVIEKIKINKKILNKFYGRISHF